MVGGKVRTAFLAFLLALLSPAFAAADTALVAKGQDFANGALGWLLKPLSSFGFGASNGFGLIEFFAAFLIIYFVMSQVFSGSSPLVNSFSSILLLLLIHAIIKLDWYTFLIHLAPSILAFMVVGDALGFVGVISNRTAKWIAFMSMILVFWTDYAYFASSNGVYFRNEPIWRKRHFVLPV